MLNAFKDQLTVKLSVHGRYFHLTSCVIQITTQQQSKNKNQIAAFEDRNCQSGREMGTSNAFEFEATHCFKFGIGRSTCALINFTN
jgi:hypothetical protein